MARPRRFEIPAGLVASGTAHLAGVQSEPGFLTLDEMDYLGTRPGPLGDWCHKVLERENEKTLSSVLGSASELPLGVEVGEFVVGLRRRDGGYWDGGSWGSDAPPGDELIELDHGGTAFVARALMEGHAGVVLRPWMPQAFLTAAVEPKEPQGSPNLPDGSVVVAVVDPLDPNAVLELLAVAPGPSAYRRNDGEWVHDQGWVDLLASVRPPPIVKVQEDIIDGVLSQVDQATAGESLTPLDRGKWNLYQAATVAASSFVRSLAEQSLQAAVDLNIGLTAVAGRELSPKDVANTERLKRYWTTGPGAAKIRWGTPGAWRRCHRIALKYMPPTQAAGWCTNLSQRLGGPGRATHVRS